MKSFAKCEFTHVYDMTNMTNMTNICRVILRVNQHHGSPNANVKFSWLKCLL